MKADSKEAGGGGSGGDWWGTHTAHRQRRFVDIYLRPAQSKQPRVVRRGPEGGGFLPTIRSPPRPQQEHSSPKHGRDDQIRR